MVSQFLIQAIDHTDENALQRRLSVREQHLNRMKEEKEKNVFITGGALLDNDKRMIGSVIILNLPDEESVRNWVAADPYVKNQVWNEISIAPFRVADI